MGTEKDLMDRIGVLTSDNSKLSGQMGAIACYLDSINIPHVPKVTKRVKLMTILYQQLQLENKRLALLIDESGDEGT